MKILEHLAYGRGIFLVIFLAGVIIYLFYKKKK
jgi:hypothetical protein